MLLIVLVDFAFARQAHGVVVRLLQLPCTRILTAG